MVRDMVQLLQDEDFTSRMTAINELSSELETDEESVAMGTAQNLNLDVSGVGSSSFVLIGYETGRLSEAMNRELSKLWAVFASYLV
jgi:hypothetical protein